MKKFSMYSILACIFMLTTASTCSNDDDNNQSQSSNPQPVISVASSGSWHITSFTDDGNDETAHFSGYNFTFGSGNALTATNGTNTYNGNWSVTSSGSDDDDSSSDLDFNIGFTAPADFADLTDDWEIVTYSANTIQLVDISGGNGGTDYLTFEKN